jgi:DNA mismatch endonuclease (patch repair protein)
VTGMDRHPPEPPDAQRSRTMSRIGGRDTKPELALRRELHRRGLRYRVQHRVLESVNRRHDVVFTRARVVVEVRGCHWHGCPEHSRRHGGRNAEWWNAKIERNRERDADTAARLAAAGWALVEVWEHDDPVEAADGIEPLVSPGRP